MQREMSLGLGLLFSWIDSSIAMLITSSAPCRLFILYNSLLRDDKSAYNARTARPAVSNGSSSLNVLRAPVAVKENILVQERWKVLIVLNSFSGTYKSSVKAGSSTATSKYCCQIVLGACTFKSSPSRSIRHHLSHFEQSSAMAPKRSTCVEIQEKSIDSTQLAACQAWCLVMLHDSMFDSIS